MCSRRIIECVICFFCGFSDHGFTIDIRVAYDLDDGIAFACFFQFDHRNILTFSRRHQCLKDEYLYILIFFIDYTDIVGIAIVIEVEVIYFIIRRIQAFFECFGAWGLFKEVESALQAKIVSRQTGRVFRLLFLCMGGEGGSQTNSEGGEVMTDTHIYCFDLIDGIMI